MLGNSLPPVLWWIHEGNYALRNLKGTLSIRLGEKVKVFCVSPYVQKTLQNTKFSFEETLLFYGLPDCVEKPDSNDPGETMLFLIVGSLESRKGQDILLEAIELLTEQEKKRSRFAFIGYPREKKIHLKLLTAIKNNNNISYYGPLSRDAVLHCYMKAVCVIVPSRDDPLPVVATESMMFSKPCICSDATGTASLITDGVDGFIFKSGDAKSLSKSIRKVLENSETAVTIGANGRKIYEKHFTIESFRNRLMSILEEF
jgi:glycosyltransferase involved in cell wall biosynthesis